MKAIHTISSFVAAAWLAPLAILSAQEANFGPGTGGAPPIPPAGGPGTNELDLLNPEVQRFFREMQRGEFMLPDPASPLRIDPDARPGDNPRWLIGLTVEPIEPFIRNHLRLDENTGVRVTYVQKDGPAAKAGIKVDDILVSAGGQPLPSLEALKEAVEKAGRNGTHLALETIQNGERKSLTLRPVDTRPESAAGPGDDARDRRFARLARRLDQQQREIEALRREVAELKKKLGAGASE